jgi:hypothetical protein
MDTTTNDILAQERKRCAAMCRNDMQALEAILHADLYFCHSSGVIDDRAAYLLKMSQGRIVYRSIDWSDQVVTAMGSGALLVGRMVSTVTVDGVEKRLDNRVMQAWAEVDGQWRLRHFQSTPLLN